MVTQTASSPSKERVLISGAAGQTGRSILEQLATMRDKVDVVAGIDSEESKNQERVLEKYNVPYVKLDGLKPDTVEKALEGVTTLILVPVGHEKRQTIGKNFIEAAAKQKVNRVIMLSTFGADNKDYYFPKRFGPIEEALEQSNVPSWTIVRPNFYAENLLPYNEDLRSGSLMLSTGQGKFSPICLADVAELVKHIMWNPEGHSKKAYELTGPESMNGEAMAEIASNELDHPIAFKEISTEEVQEILNSRNVPNDTIQGLVEFYDLVKKGRLDVVCIKDFENICGHSPKNLSWFFKQHAETLSSKKTNQ